MLIRAVGALGPFDVERQIDRRPWSVTHVPASHADPGAYGLSNVTDGLASLRALRRITDQRNHSVSSGLSNGGAVRLTSKVRGRLAENTLQTACGTSVQASLTHPNASFSSGL